MASLIERIIRILCIGAALAVFLLSPGVTLAAPFAAHVMDARTGETLYEKNANSRLHPASLTKMMTLYIAFEEISAGRLSLDTKVTISKHAAAQPPSRLGLKAGQKIALRYLIRAAAVKSANDAATAIGEHISRGSEAAFAKRMTRTAKAIGMKSTSFRNANGLTADGHLSTARDMSVMGRRLFYDYPQYYNIFSRRTADAGMAEVRNTNSRFLDSYKGADGIKTGYTNPAGFNLTASAERGGVRIIATVFGGTSTANRNAKVAQLLDLGFDAAPGRVREKKPAAPVYADQEDLMLSENDAAAIDAAVDEAANGIDVANAEGGSAKTIRVSGEVRKSLRPKSRPAPPADIEVAAAAMPDPGAVPSAAAAPDPVAEAIAEGVEGALAAAIASAPPAGTLEAQALDLAAATPAAPGQTPIVALPVVDGTAPPPAQPGTLQAQAEALAAEALALAPAGTLEAQAEALALSAPTLAAVPDPALSAFRPRNRPEGLSPAPGSDAPTELAAVAAVVEPLPSEVVVMPAPDAGTVAETAPETDMAALETESPAPADLAASVTSVESVAGATNAAPAPVALAATLMPLKRKAPIFDRTAAANLPAAPAEAEVVVRASTSGGRHFGVNVGSYTSHYEAERALLKTALAESATLNGGLRKITQKGGAFRASFMGLSEEQADLACRRLRARAVECETIGS